MLLIKEIYWFGLVFLCCNSIYGQVEDEPYDESSENINLSETGENTSSYLSDSEGTLNKNIDEAELIESNIPLTLRSMTDVQSGNYIDESGFNQNDLDGIYGKIY